MTKSRRNIYLDDSQWEQAAQAAREQSAQEERNVSTTEWIREAIRQRLEGVHEREHCA